MLSVLLSNFCALGLTEHQFEKMFFVTDRGTNIVKALENVTRLNCGLHGINNVLQNSFKQKNLDCPAIHNLIDDSKQLVAHFKRTNLMRKLKKTLKQAVCTRFNSIHTMLHSILCQYDDIVDVYPSMNIDHALLAQLVKFLAPFKDASSELESESVPKLHKVLLWKLELEEHCKEDEDDLSEIKLLKKQTRTFLETKLMLDDVHYIAAVLHPKYRGLDFVPMMKKMQIYGKIREMLALEKGVEPIAHVPPSKKSRWDAYETDDNDSDEFDNYLKLARFRGSDNDLLEWWQTNEPIFPNLAKLAKKILPIPAGSSSSERLFSVAGRVLEERRTNLRPEKVNQTLFVNSNLRLDRKRKMK